MNFKAQCSYIEDEDVCKLQANAHCVLGTIRRFSGAATFCASTSGMMTMLFCSTMEPLGGDWFSPPGISVFEILRERFDLARMSLAASCEMFSTCGTITSRSAVNLRLASFAQMTAALNSLVVSW